MNTATLILNLMRNLINITRRNDKINTVLKGRNGASTNAGIRQLAVSHGNKLRTDRGTVTNIRRLIYYHRPQRRRGGLITTPTRRRIFAPRTTNRTLNRLIRRLITRPITRTIISNFRLIGIWGNRHRLNLLTVNLNRRLKRMDIRGNAIERSNRLIMRYLTIRFDLDLLFFDSIACRPTRAHFTILVTSKSNGNGVSDNALTKRRLNFPNFNKRHLNNTTRRHRCNVRNTTILS